MSASNYDGTVVKLDDGSLSTAIEGVQKRLNPALSSYTFSENPQIIHPRLGVTELQGNRSSSAIHRQRRHYSKYNQSMGIGPPSKGGKVYRNVQNEV